MQVVCLKTDKHKGVKGCKKCQFTYFMACIYARTEQELGGCCKKIRQFGIRVCLEELQLPTLFNAYWQCLGLILEETVC